jgi:hypothetical protein
MIFFSNKSRPYHLGPYPLERLARDPDILSQEIALPKRNRPAIETKQVDGFSESIAKYHQIFHSLRDDEPAAAKAPVPDDLHRRMIDIKGSAYFLNASQVAICSLADSCWLDDATPQDHSYAVVVLVEHSRVPENGSLAQSWVADSVAEAAEFRAYEIAISVANHIQLMGYSAVAHDGQHGDVDFERLTVMAGLGVRIGDRILNPYLDDRYSICAVTTDYELASDDPLEPRAAMKAKNIAYWLGIGGSTSGLERWRQSSRPTHLSKFAMERFRAYPNAHRFSIVRFMAILERKRSASAADLRSSIRLQLRCSSRSAPWCRSRMAWLRSALPHPATTRRKTRER